MKKSIFAIAAICASFLSPSANATQIGASTPTRFNCEMFEAQNPNFSDGPYKLTLQGPLDRRFSRASLSNGTKFLNGIIVDPRESTPAIPGSTPFEYSSGEFVETSGNMVDPHASWYVLRPQDVPTRQHKVWMSISKQDFGGGNVKIQIAAFQNITRDYASANSFNCSPNH